MLADEPSQSDHFLGSIGCRNVFRFTYWIGYVVLFEFFSADHSSIQDEYIIQYALAIIMIWLKVKITIFHKFQVNISIGKLLVLSISQILKDYFYNLPMVLIQIRLVPTHYLLWVCHIQLHTCHNVHDRSHCRSIWDSTHMLSLLWSCWIILLRESNFIVYRKIAFLEILDAKLFQHDIYVCRLGQSKQPLKSIPIDLHP